MRLDNRKVILVTRGHDAAGGNAEEPGALKVFDYRNGQLTDEASVAPNGRVIARLLADWAPSRGYSRT